MKITWTVGQPTTSVKRFLSQVGISHRLLSRIKQQGELHINHEKAGFDANLVVGDAVTVRFPSEQSDPDVAISHEPIQVVFENRDWLVVNKPAGLNVVPGPANRTDTLVNRIKGHWVAEQSENLVPHIITRLDRFTSGLVLVARHQLANGLMATIQAHDALTKQYVALVSGQLPQPHDLIDAPLASDPTGYNQLVDPAGKPAQTEYWVVETFADATLVRVQLHTGRTHQIRAHFAYLGHPLIGDALYGGNQDLGLTHQALHAQRLGFTDPFDQSQRLFTADLPSDLAQVVARLQGHQ